MDPNIVNNPAGIENVGGPETGENGATYLRRLRVEVRNSPETTPADATAAPHARPATDPVFIERRQAVRFQCSGKVDFQADGSDVRLWGNLTDISLHGCYVEMPTTFPVDTIAMLNIESHGMHLRTSARVRAAYPFLGMGMCFVNTEPGQQLQLEQLLRAIAEERALLGALSLDHLSSDHLSRDPQEAQDVIASADSWAFLDAISAHFQENPTLSRDDFFSIAKRVRRS